MSKFKPGTRKFSWSNEPRDDTSRNGLGLEQIRHDPITKGNEHSGPALHVLNDLNPVHVGLDPRSLTISCSVDRTQVFRVDPDRLRLDRREILLGSSRHGNFEPDQHEKLPGSRPN